MTARLAAALDALRDRLEHLPPDRQDAAADELRDFINREAQGSARADAVRHLRAEPDPADLTAWLGWSRNVRSDVQGGLLTPEEASPREDDLGPVPPARAAA